MAKEQWHNWSRTIVSLGSILLVCGMSYQKIQDNTEVNKIQDNKIVKITETVHELELQQAEDLALKKSISETLGRMEAKMDQTSSTVSSMEKDLAVTKEKVNNLTKAE